MISSSYDVVREEDSMSGPGNWHRAPISVVEIAEVVATEERASWWFDSVHWPDG